jgi:hypothetical protein
MAGILLRQDTRTLDSTPGARQTLKKMVLMENGRRKEKRFRSSVVGIGGMPVKDWKYSLNGRAFIIDRDE